MDIYATAIPCSIQQEYFLKLLKCVSAQKQKLITRQKKPQQAWQKLIADILIRTIIYQKFKIKNSNIDFKVDAYGKPYVPGLCEFHFNISHSNKWIVCATDHMPIGIDIEFIRPVNFNIAKKLFAPEEYNSLLLKSDTERLSYFYDIWTLKESYVKAVGKGIMAIPLNSFYIKFVDGNIILESQLQPVSGYYFKQYKIDPNYKLSVCAKNQLFPKDIIFKNFDKLFEEALEYFTNGN